MIRITAWAKRSLYYWRNKIKGLPTESGPLTKDEMDEATLYHYKKTQRESYPEEITALLKQRQVNDKSKIRNLMPFLDNLGVMRMDG